MPLKKYTKFTEKNQYQSLFFNKIVSCRLTLSAPTLQNGHTHSNNFFAKSTNFLSVFDHFVGLALKGLKVDCGCFKRTKNLEQFIIFKQSYFVNVFGIFLILKYYLSNRLKLRFEIRLFSLSSINYLK